MNNDVLHHKVDKNGELMLVKCVGGTKIDLCTNNIHLKWEHIVVVHYCSTNPINDAVISLCESFRFMVILASDARNVGKRLPRNTIHPAMHSFLHNSLQIQPNCISVCKYYRNLYTLAKILLDISTETELECPQSTGQCIRIKYSILADFSNIFHFFVFFFALFDETICWQSVLQWNLTLHLLNRLPAINTKYFCSFKSFYLPKTLKTNNQISIKEKLYEIKFNFTL